MVRRLAALAVLVCCGAQVVAQGRRTPAAAGPEAAFSQLLGQPTDRSVVVSIVSATAIDAYVEWGATSGSYNAKSPVRTISAGEPAEFALGGLKPNTWYVYRVRTRAAGSTEFVARAEASFQTQRAPGQSFTFTVQGDSHPERAGRMYDAELYIRALTNVAADTPDFHFLMGDDFSIERLIEQGDNSQSAVNAVYASQRSYLGIVGKGTPLMLVNGNHEQAAKYLLDGTANNFAVLAGKARTTYFPLPAPGGIYTGNSTPVEHVGLLRDYYAWEWGDALFVVIDPYWHSPVAVDNEAGARGPARDGASARAVAAAASRNATGSWALWSSSRSHSLNLSRAQEAEVVVVVAGEGGSATFGRSPSVTNSTSGSRPRSRRATPSSSSYSAITFRAPAAAASRSRRTTSGVARIAGGAVVATVRVEHMQRLATCRPNAGSLGSFRPVRPGRSRSTT